MQSPTAKPDAGRHGEMNRDGDRLGRRGFSLVELLVVVAVIAVLVGVMLPSLARARMAARQAREMSGGQQQAVAWVLHADDHQGRVMPGYPSASMVAGEIEVLDETGQRMYGPQAQRYPWRLAPYLQYDFRGLYKDDRALEAIRSDPVMFRYVVSLYPSFGMNVEFIGGSAFSGLAFTPGAQEAYGRFYLSRIDGAYRPSEVLVFASARAADGPFSPAGFGEFGFYRLVPPRLTASAGPLWATTYDPKASEPGLNSGFVSLRYDRRAVAVMIDGHATLLGWDDLLDMRRWADRADRADWTIPVRP